MGKGSTLSNPLKGSALGKGSALSNPLGAEPPGPRWRLCLQASASFLEEKKQKTCAMPLRDISGGDLSALRSL